MSLRSFEQIGSWPSRFLERDEKLLHFRWRWLQRGKLACKFIHRKHVFVARLLILSHCLIEWLRSAQCLIEGRGAAFGIEKCIGDALCRDRVLVVTRIADKRPTGTVRLTEEIRDARRRKRAPLVFRTATRSANSGARSKIFRKLPSTSFLFSSNSE